MLRAYRIYIYNEDGDARSERFALAENDEQAMTHATGEVVDGEEEFWTCQALRESCEYQTSAAVRALTHALERVANLAPPSDSLRAAYPVDAEDDVEANVEA